MDEEVLDLLDMAFAERTQLLLAELRKGNVEYSELVTRSIQLSGQVKDCSGISADGKQLVENYLSVSAEMSGFEQKELYIQGAKDCVAALKVIGVIK